MDQLERHGLERFRLDRDLGEIDQLHAELVGERGEDVFLLGESFFDEQLVERLDRGREMGLGDARQVGGGNGAPLDQSLNQLHAVLGGARGGRALASPGRINPLVPSR